MKLEWLGQGNSWVTAIVDTATHTASETPYQDPGFFTKNGLITVGLVNSHLFDLNFCLFLIKKC